MAVLLEDGTICYGSAEELLADYEEHIRNGGMLLESDCQWLLRKTREFVLVIDGMDFRLAVKAEPVHCSNGQVGLQLDDELSNWQAIEAFIYQLRDNPDALTPAAQAGNSCAK